jgi:hypothetical protein
MKLFSRPSDKNFVSISDFSHAQYFLCYTTLLDLITLISGREYRFWSSYSFP